MDFSIPEAGNKIYLDVLVRYAWSRSSLLFAPEAQELRQTRPTAKKMRRMTFAA